MPGANCFLTLLGIWSAARFNILETGKWNDVNEQHRTDGFKRSVMSDNTASDYAKAAPLAHRAETRQHMQESPRLKFRHNATE